MEITAVHSHLSPYNQYRVCLPRCNENCATSLFNNSLSIQSTQPTLYIDIMHTRTACTKNILAKTISTACLALGTARLSPRHYLTSSSACSDRETAIQDPGLGSDGWGLAHAASSRETRITVVLSFTSNFQRRGTLNSPAEAHWAEVQAPCHDGRRDVSPNPEKGTCWRLYCRLVHVIPTPDGLS
ncbi:hypothetical protein GGI35DRAFT_350720 [Trichoderma velutinum]